MSFLNLIKSAISSTSSSAGKPAAQPTGTAQAAKNRLHVLLVNDRAGTNCPDFFPQLRMEIMEVIKKYVPLVDIQDVEIKYENTMDAHILEMSISLENAMTNRSAPESDGEEPRDEEGQNIQQ